MLANDESTEIKYVNLVNNRNITTCRAMSSPVSSILVFNFIAISELVYQKKIKINY